MLWWASYASAEWWAEKANFLLVCSLVAVAATTIVVISATNEKEHHWDKERKGHRDKIIELEAEAANAKVEVGKAHVEIAKAHERSAQLEKDSSIAKLELERTRAELTGFRLPRRLSKGKKTASRRMGLATVSPFWITGDRRAP